MNSNEQTLKVGILILTAVEVEYQAVREKVESLETIEDPRTFSQYEIGTYLNYRIAIRCTGQGNPKMALEAERAIKFLNPDVVFLVGIAGGRKPQKVKIGDVLIVTRTYSYESGIIVEKDFFKSREKGGSLDNGLIEVAKGEARNKDWLTFTSHKDDKYKVISGAVASGEKIIASSNSSVANWIDKSSQDALAVEMEGIGLTTALHALNNVRGLIIRGISDMLDGKEEHYSKGGRELAAENACAFALQVINRLPEMTINVTEIEPEHILHLFPRGPSVESFIVKIPLIEAYAANIKPVRAMAVVRSANALRKEADPNATIIEDFDLPPVMNVNPFVFWDDVFNEARLNGPRMLAAILLVIKDDQFPEEVKKIRLDILEHLRLSNS